ncbi:MAG: NAD(P)-dependent oxidoreductase [Pseudorhodobacter sp.]
MVPSVLVTEPVHEEALALLRDAGWSVRMAGAQLDPADALLVRVRPVSDSEVGLFRMIAKHGVGVDNIAMEAARAAGIAVMNTPGANAGAVAEQALMLMLALARDLPAQMAAAAAGTSAPRVTGLEGRRLLVLGYGASGARLCHLARALGMAVTVLTRRPDAARAEGYAIATDPDSALGVADVVSLHCPLSESTRGLLSAQRLAALPKGALIVNCARGGLIDMAALAAGLVSGHLGGAGLDVTDPEPLPPDHPLRQAPRLILTPHAAAMSEGAFRRMGMMAAQNILDHFAGRPDPAHLLVPGGLPSFSV